MLEHDGPLQIVGGDRPPALSIALPAKESDSPTVHLVAADGAAIVAWGTPADTIRVVVPVSPAPSVTVSRTV